MEEEIKPIEETPAVPDTTPTVTEEEPVIDEVIDTSIPTVDDYNKLSVTNKQLYERAKKAEQKAKELEGKVNKPLTNQELSPDEIRLLAKGVSDEDIVYLKRLQAGAKAMGEDVSLSKLLAEDPAYLALVEKRAKEDKSKKAALGGSGRSVTNSESPIKSGMSREDHKKVWEQVNKELGV